LAPVARDIEKHEDHGQDGVGQRDGGSSPRGHSLFAAVRQRMNAAIPHGSLKRRLASGVFWSLSGTLAAQALGAAAGIITARVLGKAGYGELGMIQGTMMMLGTFAGLGLGDTNRKYIAELRGKDPVRAGRILGFSTQVAVLSGLIMAAAVAVGARYLAEDVLGAPRLTGYIRLSSVLLLLGPLAGVQSAAIEGFEGFRHLNHMRITLAAVGSLLMIVGAVRWGITGAIWAILLGTAVGIAGYRLLLHRYCRAAGIPFCFRDAWQERRLMWKFALPALLSGVFVGPVYWAASAMVVNTPGGFGELGVFNAANQWRSLILFVLNAVGAVALPVLANLYGNNDSRRYAAALKANLALNLTAGLAIGVCVVFARSWIMMLYGRSFSAGASVLVLLAATAVLQGVGVVVGSAIASTGRMWQGLCLNVLWAAEFLVATRLLLDRGAVGLGAAYLISYFLHTLQLGVFTWFLTRSPSWCRRSSDSLRAPLGEISDPEAAGQFLA